MKKYDYILVGSGLYAGVFAWYARKNKKRCLVVEKRNHIGGNVYCEDVEGIHVHKYGAHIFHTGNRKVWEFVNSLAEFNRYTNSPVANYKGQMYNMPFNMNTFSRMWGISTPDEAKAIIEKQRAEITGEPKNLEEQAIRLVGRELYEKLIKGYTEKQWGRDCRELPAFIIKRIPVRYIYDNNYFNDPYQGIPVGGYNVIVRKLFEGCDIETSVDYLEHREHYDSLGETVVYTGTIDAFYGYRFGRLEYRSLRFESEELDKVREAKESRTIEFFMGSLDDTQALFLYNGLMETLQEYLDDGTLVCKSGKLSFDDTGILRWSKNTAKSRAAEILEQFYPDGAAPDIICTGFDDAAGAVQEALQEAGVVPGTDIWPMITGNGCKEDAVKRIASGTQAFSVFMDFRELADQCEEMVNVYLHGEDDPEVNDYEQYDNGVKIIGTYLCESQMIDRDNYEILIDNGYYSEKEVEPDPTETPTPEPVTPTEAAEPTVTPTEAPKEVSPTPAETETPTPTEKAEPTKKPTSTPKPTATETPTPTEKAKK